MAAATVVGRVANGGSAWSIAMGPPGTRGSQDKTPAADAKASLPLGWVVVMTQTSRDRNVLRWCAGPDVSNSLRQSTLEEVGACQLFLRGAGRVASGIGCNRLTPAMQQ
jgi:hypothetical protein